MHDYHLGNTAGFWARWSSECVHTALRRNHLVPCTAVQTLQDRRHHDWLHTLLGQLKFIWRLIDRKKFYGLSSFGGISEFLLQSLTLTSYYSYISQNAFHCLSLANHPKKNLTVKPTPDKCHFSVFRLQLGLGVQKLLALFKVYLSFARQTESTKF